MSKLCEIRFPGKIPVLGRLINQSDNGFCVESPFGLEYGPVIISGDEFGIIVGRIRWRLGRKAGGVVVNGRTFAGPRIVRQDSGDQA